MSIPTFAFLDTSIFDGQQYNFSSTAFSTFAPACKARGVKLILPDPTEREIQRHIRDKSKQAVEALEAAIRKAPFLSKWRRFSQKAGPDWEVQKVARDEWNAFMNQFDVIRLGYESLNVKQVMDWYDQNSAPFGQGKKRKEFPDAISIAILADYAQKNGCYIAVVASDADFEAACKRYSSLLYFKSLPSLTELLISSDDERVATLQKAIEDDIDLLEEAVYSEVLDTVDLYHEGSNGYFHLEDDHRDFERLSIYGVSVVAVGSSEATVTFDAVVTVKFRLTWEERGSDDYQEFEYRDLEEDASISGTAKISFDETAKKVTGVTFVELDATEIELQEEP